MKVKKTVTDEVLAANRANSKASTGPRTERGQTNSQFNAVRHGLLSKNLFLKTDDEHLAFQDLTCSCLNEFHPVGFLEDFLVEEIATTIWKIQIAVGLETKELSSRKTLRERVSGVFEGEIELPLGAEDLPVDRGWDCERLVVRATASRDVGTAGGLREPSAVQGQRVPDSETLKTQHAQMASHVTLEAVLGNALTNITRYQGSLKGDLYRAIQTLRSLQEKRCEQNGGD